MQLPFEIKGKALDISLLEFRSRRIEALLSESTTTRKTGGLILTLKGSVVFTAEPQPPARGAYAPEGGR